MAIAAGLAILRQEPSLTGPDIAWSVVGGILGGIGITALYRGLAVGRMGSWRPVTGVLAAMIPVVAGILLEGLPEAMVLVGIGLALLAVVLVSRVADEGGGRQGLGLARARGDGDRPVRRGHRRDLRRACLRAPGDRARLRGGPDRRDHPRDPVRLAPAGEPDAASCWPSASSTWPGTPGTSRPCRPGRSRSRRCVSGLYPVTTVVLAAVFLHERVTRSHAVGIVLASLAVALIGIGSA